MERVTKSWCDVLIPTDTKGLHGTAPRYLGPLVRVSDLPGWRRLRSASTDRLVVPPFKLSTIGSRTFNVAAARTWNGLPVDVTLSPTLPAFRKGLLLRESYLDIIPQLNHFV